MNRFNEKSQKNEKNTTKIEKFSIINSGKFHYFQEGMESSGTSWKHEKKLLCFVNEFEENHQNYREIWSGKNKHS